MKATYLDYHWRNITNRKIAATYKSLKQDSNQKNNTFYAKDYSATRSAKIAAKLKARSGGI